VIFFDDAAVEEMDRTIGVAGEARLYWFGLAVVGAAFFWRLMERDVISTGKQQTRKVKLRRS